MTYFTTTNLKLNVEKYCTSIQVSNEFLRSARLVEREDYLDYTKESLILTMTALVACSDEKTIEQQTPYPASAWDHVKQDYFPKWLLDKFPVKYTTSSLTIKVKEVFPEYAILDKDGKRHLHFRTCSPNPTNYTSRY